MARQRMLHPEFWSDIALGTLGPWEKLMFIGMISHADDEGRLPADPVFLRNAIFPFNDIELSEIAEIRGRLSQAMRSIRLYEVEGKEYVAILSWKKYQKPRFAKASKIPAPPTDEKKSEEHCGGITDTLQHDYGKTTVNVQQEDGKPATALQQPYSTFATTDSDSDSDSDSDRDSDRDPRGRTDEMPDLRQASLAGNVPHEQIIKAFNETCTGMRKVRSLTVQRRKAISARWKNNRADPMAHFQELFAKAGRSSFLNGINDRAWSADFDWLMKEQNAVKVLEGKYDDPARAPAGLKHTLSTARDKPETNAQKNARIAKELMQKFRAEEGNNGN